MNGKNENIPLEDLAVRILSLIVLEENFENIYWESGEKNKKIVLDVLRTLIVKDLVRVYEETPKGFKLVSYVDPDAFETLYFRITAKGYLYL
jgi:hypothetical protein